MNNPINFKDIPMAGSYSDYKMLSLDQLTEYQAKVFIAKQCEIIVDILRAYNMGSPDLTKLDNSLKKLDEFGRMISVAEFNTRFPKEPI